MDADERGFARIEQRQEKKLSWPRIYADYADPAEARLWQKAHLKKKRVQRAVSALASARSA
ncbi:hypothetical protein GCM10007164_25020 [Luteimonas padinae]|nr:hypothetical protein GCM10007164_25020 [Luteimonas padinae]